MHLHTERLLLFTDAGFSVILSLLVINLRYTEHELEGFEGSAHDFKVDFLKVKIPAIGRFFSTSLTLLVLWSQHAALFRAAEHPSGKTSGTVFAVNLASLILIGLVPFSRVFSAFSHGRFGMLLLSGVMAGVCGLLFALALALRAVRRTQLPELGQAGEAAFALGMWRAAGSFIVCAVTWVATFTQIFGTSPLFLEALWSSIFISSRASAFVFTRARREQAFWLTQLEYNPRAAPVHRLEALADGVFVVVSTLILSDITPPPLNASAEKVLKELSERLGDIVAYIVSSATSAFLWSAMNRAFHLAGEGADAFGFTLTTFLALCFSVFLPLSTSVLLKVRFSPIPPYLYAGTLFLTSVMIAILPVLARRGRWREAPRVARSKRSVWRDTAQSLVLPLTAVIMAIAAAAGASKSAAWFLIIPVATLPLAETLIRLTIPKEPKQGRADQLLLLPVQENTAGGTGHKSQKS